MGQGGLKKKKGPKPGEKIKTVDTEAQPANSKRVAAAAAAAASKSSKKKATATDASSSSPAQALSAKFEPLSAGGATDYSDADAEDPTPTAMQLLDSSTAAAVKREVRQAKRQGPKPTPAGAAVVYLGHIPHGFYEEQMKGFFSQFGTVSRLRLARNKKTGRSKHYAFIEFKDADVGGIVARAMDGYLLFSKLLVAKVLPPESVHAEMFKGAHRAFRVIDTAAVRRQQHNKPRTADQAGKREQQLVKAEGKKRKKLAAAGIDYEFGGYAAEAEQPNRKRVRGVQTTMPTAQDDGEEDALIVEKAMAALKAPKKQSAKQLNEEEEKAAPPKKAAKGKKRAAAEEEEAPPPAKPPAPAAASKKAKTKK